MDKDLISKIEEAHILFNMGTFFSSEIKHEEFTILFNNELPQDPYLNYVTKIRIRKNSKLVIDHIEQIFAQNKSKPSFYLMPYTHPKNFKDILVKKGYSIFTRDAWMFFDLKKKVQYDMEIRVRKITKKEIADFKRVFNEVYTKGEEDDPYKGLSYLYGEFLEKRLIKKQKEFVVEAYAAFMDDKLVGTIVIIHNRSIACLYALAVLPQFRNRGIGKALIAACIQRAQNMKLQQFFLQTEKNSRNEKIFSKIGFRTFFVAEQYYKPN